MSLDQKLDRKIEMFSPPKLTTIVAALTALMSISAVTNAQDADYNRRLAAMQQARERANPTQPAAVRVASNDLGADYSAPPAPASSQRIVRSSQKRSNESRSVPTNKAPRQATQASYQTAAAPRGRNSSENYMPQHLRTAQLYDEQIIDGGSPIIEQPGCTTCGDNGAYETIVADEYVDDGYYEEGGCSTCGDAGSYFNCGDGCCGRGGCPPGPCWLAGFGAILFRGDYFGGAQGSQNAMFAVPGGNGTLINDSSFGVYGGANFGIPLCRLTCGLLSGQFGFRSVQTNFNGGQYSPENRDQTFITAGLYRRVDYGLQGGVVADILYENWFTETETVQIRADLGWVWPGGTTFGFRYADNVQDDNQPATINGVSINSLNTSSEDYYRFYLRREIPAGGSFDMSLGWTDSNQTIFASETDLPITNKIAAQATVTYYLNDDAVPANSGQMGGNLGEAWNIGVGLAWRPQGRAHYRSYDRPLFNVADNGSMLIKRN
jgi:hypothetical protein